jgi:hypothetical protein
MFHFENLNDAIRLLMLNEAESDRLAVSEYYGRRLTAKGHADWPTMLRNAITTGDEATLAADLRFGERLKSHEEQHRKTGVILQQVPFNAADILAQGEFNRYYIRAVCRSAIEKGITNVDVYRGRHSANPRPESEALIVGRLLDAKQLLEDIRAHPGEQTHLGIPLVNSGLSVRLP